MSGKTWLDRRHPGYTRMAGHWSFLADSYRGGPVWFNESNLPKYPSEHPEKYRHRLANATRANYTREVIDRHTGYLFRQKPTRSGSPLLEQFWAKAERTDGDMNDLAAEIATLSALFGFCAVVVDKPAGVPLSRLDEGLPYCYTLSPLDVLDWSRDENGDLRWILTCERVRDDADPIASSGTVTERYRLRTRDGWQVYRRVNQAAELVEQGTWRLDGSPLPQVPVILVAHSDTDSEYDPPGLVDEIARIDRLIAQEQSSLHEVIEWLGAPTLVYPGEVENPITLGVSGVITYSESSPTPPQFLSIDAGYLSALQDRIVSLIDKLRELACLPSNTANNRSGESKRWDNLELSSVLSAKAANLQAAEAKIAMIVGAFLGESGEASIVYPSSYDVTDLATDLQAAIVLNELPGALSPTYRQRLAERLAAKSLPDESQMVMDQIMDEIEASLASEAMPVDPTEPQDAGDMTDPQANDQPAS